MPEAVLNEILSTTGRPPVAELDHAGAEIYDEDRGKGEVVPPSHGYSATLGIYQLRRR